MNKLLKEKNWKVFAGLGGISLVTLALLDSFLFVLVVDLLKVVLGIIGGVSLAYALYLAYPLVKKVWESYTDK